MIEIELKFLLTAQMADKVEARISALSGLKAPPRLRTLHSVYHDTPDHALRRKGLALRLRHDGAQWVQTVKGRMRHDGALQSTREDETIRPDGSLDLDAIADDALRGAVQACAAAQDLSPVIETRMDRVEATVARAGLGTVEIALDRGTLHAGTAHAPLIELEVELKSGALALVFDIARDLLPDGGLHLSRRSKAARAFDLSEGLPAIAPPAPRSAQKLRPDKGASAEDAARATLRACFDQIAANMEATRATDAVEAPHQLRIGLRRLRTALRIFAPVLRGTASDHLEAEARWLGRTVGDVRDLDVTLADVTAPLAKTDPGPGFAALSQALTDRAHRRRADLRRMLNAPRAQGFVLDLAQFTETRGWRRTPVGKSYNAKAADVLRAATVTAWKDARRRAKNIKTLSGPARHDLRKAIKHLRYTLDFAGTTLPAKPQRAYAKRLRHLQDAFGTINDLAVAEAVLTGVDAPAATDPDAQRATGLILGARRAQAHADWPKACALWADLRATPKPWKRG
jgi:inorganic triphosphatase YgiF